MELSHLVILTLSLALAGTISVLFTVVWQNAEQRLDEARAETPPPTIDIAINAVDLAQLRTLAKKLNVAYSIRYDRLARMSEEDRDTRIGLQLAYTCWLLMDASNGVDEVVEVLNGSERVSRAKIKEVALEMLEWIEKEEETIPLKLISESECNLLLDTLLKSKRSKRR